MISIGNPLMDMALNGGRKIVDDYLDRVVDYGWILLKFQASLGRRMMRTCRLIDVASRGLKVINEVGSLRSFKCGMIFSEIGSTIQRFLNELLENFVGI